MNGKKKTSETFHVYINPQEKSIKKHKKFMVFLMKTSKISSFSEIAEDLLEFIDGSTLVIHNADFDVGLDAEFKIASSTYPSI